MNNNIKVAIYIRVSTSEQALEGYSLAAQENVLRNYCKAKNYEIYKVYADEGISAKSLKNRPSMQRLIKDGLDGFFDIILVWKLSRFTRNLSDLCSVCDKLEKRSVYLVSYSEGFDSRTPVGRMIRGILGTVAQWEREVISENVKAAMTERAKQGHRTCSYLLGYDVIKGKEGMTVNRKEAEIVKFIYDTYLECKSIMEVTRRCADRKYRGKKGGYLKPESIHKILTRFIYCGYYSWHRTPIKGDFEPIITVEQYNKVQYEILRRGANYGKDIYSKIVFLD